MRCEPWLAFVGASIAMVNVSNPKGLVFLLAVLPQFVVPYCSRWYAARRPDGTHDGSMRAEDHPNNSPGVPMRFPPWFENLQIKYINPVAVPLARFMPGVTVISHRGRKTGRRLQTAVSAYRKGGTVAIMLAHGKTNWVKNVLAAGEADIRLGGRDVHLVNPRIVPAGQDDPSLPRMARMAAQRGVGVFVADVA